MVRLADALSFRLPTRVLLAACLMVMAPPLWANDFKIVSGVHFPEGDIRTPIRDPGLRNIGIDACRAACRAESRCAAFTYYDTAKWCFLKGAVGKQVADGDTTSGIRLLTTRAVSAPEQFSFFGLPTPPVLAPPLPSRNPGVRLASRTRSAALPETADKSETRQAAKQAPKPKAEAPKPARPIVETDKHAKTLYSLVKAAMAYANQAKQISARYLRKYDTQQATTQMFKGPLGIRVPVQFNRSQAKALVMDKMGKDSRLNSLQTKLDRAERQGSQLFKRVAHKFEPQLRRSLNGLHTAHLRASGALRSARSKLTALGKRLNQKADRLQFPSPEELRTLHRLVAVMRTKRRTAIEKGHAFQTALRRALKEPMVAGYVRRIPTASSRR